MTKNNDRYDQKRSCPYARCGLFVRICYLFVSLVFWVLSGFSFFLPRKGVVLCYHGVMVSQAKRFEDQMRWLRRWSTLSTKFSRPAVWITFDDAFCNLEKTAISVLNRHQIPALIFAVAGNLGDVPRWEMQAGHPEANEKTMTDEQLAAISKYPLISIGSHTQTHPDLSRLSPEKTRAELAHSKNDLEHILSRPIEDLALPHGAFNESVLKIARQVGYKRIYTLQPRLMTKEQMHQGLIGRFSMSPDVWPIEFYLTCAGAYAWLLPWRSFIRGVRRLLQRV